MRRSLAWIAAWSLPAACGGSGTGVEPRNLLLISIDTLRADHVGAYGYHRDTTPTIDALAAESVVFERCIAPIPRTMPGHASLLSAVYPYEHGIVRNIRARDERHVTFVPTSGLRSIAQVLGDQGYRTGGFVSATPVKRVTGLDVGFEGWTEPAGDRRPAAETNADAIEWLAGLDDGRPFFLFLHYYDPHGPYRDVDFVPPEYLERYRADEELESWMAERAFPEIVDHKGDIDPRILLDVYDGCVRYADDRLAEILDAVRKTGRWDSTVVVLLSDHGQGLGQHDFVGHAVVWGEQLHVPLMIRVPGRAPERIGRTLSIVDVVPTVLPFLPGVDASDFLADCQGRDALAEVLAGGEELAVTSMSIHEPIFHSLTTDRWKYVHHSLEEVELYDLRADPHELRNVAAENPGVVATLQDRLMISLAEQRKRGDRHRAEQGNVSVQVDPAIFRELEALGYGGDDE